MTAYSLYIHTPFCAKKCHYCDFTSYAGIEHMISPYLAALRNELSAYASALESNLLKTIYFGGGTPSVLPEKDIESIMNEVTAKFTLEERAEISIEVNPGTVNLAKLMTYKKSGINRISIGAQSFNDKELKALGRIHTEGQISYTFNAARNAGFDNINLDLMFALPDQDLIGWSNNLKKALSLKPDHISTYNLVIEEGTVFHGKRTELAMPSEDTEALMFEEAIDALTSHGFSHYEISNFAKPGRECRNNLTYWRNEEYIGIGAGATSFISGSRFSNPVTVEEYVEVWGKPDPKIIADNHSKNEQGAEQTFQETIFLGLRLTEGIDVDGLIKKFGKGLILKYEKVIAELQNDGLLAMENSRLKLTKRGLFIANVVFERFV